MPETIAHLEVRMALLNLKLARRKLAKAVDEAEADDDAELLKRLRPTVWKVDAAIAEVEKL